MEGIPTSATIKRTSDEVFDEEDMEERKTKRGIIAGVSIGLMSFLYWRTFQRDWRVSNLQMRDERREINNTG